MSWLSRTHVSGSVGALVTAVLLAVPSPADAATGIELFAAPAGSGSTCTSSVPCSLTGAQTEARKQVPTGKQVTITLRDGRYDLAQTLRLTAADSGSADAPVVWRAEHAGKALLSGGTRVQGWALHDPGNGIWVADVPAGSATRQVYVDGSWAPIAQATAVDLGFASQWTGTSTGYQVTDAASLKWLSSIGAADRTRLEFVYTGKTGAWTQSRCPVAGISTGPSSATVTMLATCWAGMTKRPARATVESGGLPNMATSTVPTYVANNYSLLSAGEWYLDQAANKLYFAAPKGADPASMDITLPKLERLVSIAGSLSNPVHDLRFEGLQFSYATWLAPTTTGFAEVQSNLHITGAPNQGKCAVTNPAGTCPYGALAQPLGNVDVTASRNISFEGNTFRALGGAGLSVRYGARGTRIVGNHITETSSTGLYLGCTFDPQPLDATTHAAIKTNCTPDASVVANDTIGENEIMKDTYVADNVIHSVGRDYKAAPGATILFGQDLQFVHNEVYDTPYTGVTGGIVQGHATDSDNPGNNPNVNARNSISNNLIYNYMQELHDGGAIYLEGHQGQYIRRSDGSLDTEATLTNGMLASGNIALNDAPDTNFTYYDDAGSQFIKWAGNAAINTAGTAQGGCAPAGYLWTVDNYFGRAVGRYPCSPAAIAITVQNNHRIPVKASLADVPETLVAAAGREPGYANVSGVGPVKLRYTSDRASDGKVLLAVTGMRDDTEIYAGGVRLQARRIGTTFVEVDVPDAVASQPIAVGAPGSWFRVNETDARMVVSGWTADSGRPFGDYRGDISYTKTNGSSLEFSFTGSKVRLYGERNSDQGTVTVSIDGAAPESVDTYASTRQADAVLIESGTLSSGKHTVKIVKTGGKFGVFDGYSFLPVTWSRVNDTDAGLVVSGWLPQSGRGFGDLRNDIYYSTATGASLEFFFTGSKVRLYGERNSDQGTVTVSIDGAAPESFDTYARARQADVLVFESALLQPGRHNVKVVKTGGQYGVFDGYSYY